MDTQVQTLNKPAAGHEGCISVHDKESGATLMGNFDEMETLAIQILREIDFHEHNHGMTQEEIEADIGQTEYKREKEV